MCARRSHSDSNRGNRSHGSTVFKTAAINHSAIAPLSTHRVTICCYQSAVKRFRESFFLPVSLFNHSARCASPGSNRDPGLVTGTRTSTSRVCQFRHKRTEPDGMGRRNRRQIDESILIATISSKKKVGPLFFPLSVPTSCPSFRP